MDKEEGEMSDDAMAVDDENDEPLTEMNSNHTVIFKAEKDGIIVEKLERIDASKLEERAKRFGLDLSGNRMVTQKQIDELYSKAGIVGNERHYRFDTLHLNGIEGLTTREIFEYLEDYKPVSLEKIDDVSCNIVCQDNISAALALLVHSREIKNEQLNEMLREKSQHHWREGMPHPRKDLILMRFATNADKKISNKKHEDRPICTTAEVFDESMDPISKNPWGDLCKSWGVYDHQEIFQRKLPKNDYEDEVNDYIEPVKIKNKSLALRLGKRHHKIEESDDSSSDSEWRKKSKTPRMRMRADDEESKNKKKHIKELSRDEDSDDGDDKDSFAPLSIEVINSRSSYGPRQTTKLSEKFKSHDKLIDSNLGRGSIQSRLGAKMVPTENWPDNESEESGHNIYSRVQKVESSVKSSSSNVWSRLDSNSSDRQSDLRQILKSRKDPITTGKPDDLRERLSKAKKSNLRIEIDNY